MSIHSHGVTALSKSQVAQRLGVHKTTILRMVKAGRFPPPSIRNERVVRWSSDVVESFIHGGGA